MSGGFVPSKSTVYVSNLPFDLSNNDLHKLFEKYGKIVKVTIVKERETRKSKGVAFILFLTREGAMKCVEETNLSQVFGRTLKASIAKDNGRCTEFIKRKEYPNKTRCYECGEFGHLSYNCSKNLLGERQPPPKKVKKKKKKESTGLSKEQIEYFDSSEDERCEDVTSKSTKRPKKDDHEGAEEDEEDAVSDDETLSAAIAYEQERHELEQYRLKVATGNYDNDETRIGEPKRKKIKKSSYFSDEEESD